MPPAESMANPWHTIKSTPTQPPSSVSIATTTSATTMRTHNRTTGFIATQASYSTASMMSLGCMACSIQTTQTIGTALHLIIQH